MSFFGKESINFAVTEIKGLDVKKHDFVQMSTRSLYERIIHYVIKEVAGDEGDLDILTLSAADNFSPFSRGFVYFAAEAITQRSQIFIKKQLLPDGSEYLFSRVSRPDDADLDRDVIELDFRSFEQSLLVKEFYGLLWDALQGGAKGIKISQGLLIKINRLTEIMAGDREIKAVNKQMTHISEGLRDASTAYMDSQSSAEFASFDTGPTEKSVEFSHKQLSNITGFSMSFINGQGGSAMSDTGESDRKQNRSAAEYFFTLFVQSMLKSIFNKTYKLKPQLDNLSDLPSMLSAIEMWSEGTEEGKKFLYSQIGIQPSMVNINNSGSGNGSNS